MKIETTRFGGIEVEDNKIIRFEEGIPGFEDQHKFALLTPEDTAPFYWLQSVEESDVALLVAEPSNIIKDYKPDFPCEVLDALEIETDTECLILVVVVIPRDFKQATANLAAPILINVEKRKAMQVVLDTGTYMVRYEIFKNSSKGRESKCSY